MSDKCEECDAVLEEKMCLVSRSWDWFRGYFPRTYHFCPKHKNSTLRHRLFAESQVKPPNWESQSSKRQRTKRDGLVCRLRARLSGRGETVKRLMEELESVKVDRECFRAALEASAKHGKPF